MIFVLFLMVIQLYFLRSKLGERSGDIVDVDGRVVGSHSGYFAYTVGQRRGFGFISSC